MGSGGREARVCLAFLQFLRAGEIYIGGRGTGEIRPSVLTDRPRTHARGCPCPAACQDVVSRDMERAIC